MAPMYQHDDPTLHRKGLGFHPWLWQTHASIAALLGGPRLPAPASRCGYPAPWLYPAGTACRFHAGRARDPTTCVSQLAQRSCTPPGKPRYLPPAPVRGRGYVVLHQKFRCLARKIRGPAAGSGEPARCPHHPPPRPQPGWGGAGTLSPHRKGLVSHPRFRAAGAGDTPHTRWARGPAQDTGWLARVLWPLL